MGGGGGYSGLNTLFYNSSYVNCYQSVFIDDVTPWSIYFMISFTSENRPFLSQLCFVNRPGTLW